jgi:hypothetical protein
VVSRERWPAWLTVVVTVVALVCWALIGLVGIGAWLAYRGCGSVDPGDPENYSVVSIYNDIQDTVVLGPCWGAYCDSTPVTIPVGHATEVDAACAATGSDMTSWQVTDAVNGLTIGFIAVDTPSKHDGLMYPVSRASKTRSIATQPVPTAPAVGLDTWRPPGIAAEARWSSSYRSKYFRSLPLISSLRRWRRRATSSASSWFG